MKLVHREFEKNGSGSVTMVPEEGEVLTVHPHHPQLSGWVVRTSGTCTI